MSCCVLWFRLCVCVCSCVSLSVCTSTIILINKITLVLTCKRVRVRYERLKFRVCFKFDTKKWEPLYFDVDGFFSSHFHLICVPCITSKKQQQINKIKRKRKRERNEFNAWIKRHKHTGYDLNKPILCNKFHFDSRLLNFCSNARKKWAEMFISTHTNNTKNNKQQHKILQNKGKRRTYKCDKKYLVFFFQKIPFNWQSLIATKVFFV